MLLSCVSWFVGIFKERKNNNFTLMRVDLLYGKLSLLISCSEHAVVDPQRPDKCTGRLAERADLLHEHRNPNPHTRTSQQHSHKHARGIRTAKG